MNHKTFFLILYFTLNFAFAQEGNKVQPAHELLHEFVNLRDFCLSQNGTEIYFTIQSPGQDISQIACMKMQEGKWSKPKLMPFCDQYAYLEPFLTPDQTKLYFVSNRPIDPNSAEAKDYDIWYVQRADMQSEWSAPINIGAPINTSKDEFYPTLTKSGNLYFTADLPSGMGKDDIYLSRWDGKQFSSPEILDTLINSSGYEFNSFISENEDFIIYTRYNSPGGLGSGDLYISRRNKQGNWSKAENLAPPINTKYMEYCPFYHATTETLYFTSRRNELEPQNFKTVGELQQYIMQHENGLSKLYKVKFPIKEIAD